MRDQIERLDRAIAALDEIANQMPYGIASSIANATYSLMSARSYLSDTLDAIDEAEYVASQPVSGEIDTKGRV